MQKSERVELARETVQIVKEGAYRNAAGALVSVQAAVERAVTGSVLYRDADFPAERVPLSHGLPVRIELTGETTLQAIARLHDEAPDADIFALNFASARNPGGGFLSGAQAQEESLARASALYACQCAQFALYEHNRGRVTLLYSDWMIWSPAVPIFRGEDGGLLDAPHCATFLTAPAVNAGVVREAERGQIDAVNRERARKLLWIANRKGHRLLVLGAWGCGVFRNDPGKIAAMFDELLRGEFAGCFERVVMAVYDTSRLRRTYAAFAEQFA